MESDSLQNLTSLGWLSYLSAKEPPVLPEGCTVARVAIQHKTNYVLYSEHGELRGEVAGKLFYMSSSPQELPAVGDWVVINPRPEEEAATILDVLPRKSKFSRHAAGKRIEEQIIAANVDKVFLVTGLDGDFNPRRLERYLVVAHESGAQPIIVLNKADLCEDTGLRVREVEAIAKGAPVVSTSAIQNDNLDELRKHLGTGVTAALIGSSGVGKSTIANCLVGGELRTGEVRWQDDKGRHVTTQRELLLVPSGGLLIDTPGMRELQLWGGDEGIQDAFEDIAELAAQCRFNDCKHEVEPDCAVRAALEDGSLDKARYHSYLKLQKEIAYQIRKNDQTAQILEKEKVKKMSYEQKRIYGHRTRR